MPLDILYTYVRMLSIGDGRGAAVPDALRLRIRQSQSAFSRAGV